MNITAERMAKELRKHGFTVKRSTEGNDVEDGCVELSDVLHVQVSTIGDGFGVTREVNGEFLFSEPLASMTAVVRYLRANPEGPS